MDIILTALYNLEILHQRQYFHCKSEICAFIDHHWSSICPERARSSSFASLLLLFMSGWRSRSTFIPVSPQVRRLGATQSCPRYPHTLSSFSRTREVSISRNPS